MNIVSTHSRPKAAALFLTRLTRLMCVSTHSRPKAAAKSYRRIYRKSGVSTHSRPKAAARALSHILPAFESFNTQPPEGGCRSALALALHFCPFQHTAARRRLLHLLIKRATLITVSTHSRPKAAAVCVYLTSLGVEFQHTAARRRLLFPILS